MRRDLCTLHSTCARIDVCPCFMQYAAGSRIHPRITAAGRTDAGVHALHQVCHFDIPTSCHRDTERLLASWNAHLRDADVRVMRVQRVCSRFHARYSARSRTYRYQIVVGERT